MIAQIDKEYRRLKFFKIGRRLLSYFLEGRPLTTRGRWFNRVLFIFYYVVVKGPAIFKKVKSPVYIVGTGRSGTTILGKILSVHKDIGFLNEPKAIWHSIYPDEDISGNFSDRDSQYRLSGIEADSNVIKKAHKLFGFYQSITFSKKIIDKYPEMIFRYDFIKKIFPDAKFIFLVRNGWDTAISIDNWSKKFGNKKNGDVLDWWGKNNRKWNLIYEQLVGMDEELNKISGKVIKNLSLREKAAIEWILTLKEGMKMIKKFPKDFTIIKYENLATDPALIIKQLMEFIDLKGDKTVIDYAEKALKPAKSKGVFKMDSEIELIFKRVLSNFNYE